MEFSGSNLRHLSSGTLQSPLPPGKFITPFDFQGSLPFALWTWAKLAMNSKEALSTFWLPWSFTVDCLVGLTQYWRRSRPSLSQYNTWESCCDDAFSNNEKQQTYNQMLKWIHTVVLTPVSLILFLATNSRRQVMTMKNVIISGKNPSSETQGQLVGARERRNSGKKRVKKSRREREEFVRKKFAGWWSLPYSNFLSQLHTNTWLLILSLLESVKPWVNKCIVVTFESVDETLVCDYSNES